jgi:tetratricopeptide (TPR) repeat protein
MFKLTGALLTIFFLLTCSQSVFCQAAAPSSKPTNDAADQPAIIEELSTSARFENDGSSVQTVRQRVKLQNEAGIRLFGIITFSYISGNDFSIDTVEVHKKDGGTIKAGPSNVQEVTPEISRNAPTYSDLRQKQVTVPGLSVGDEVIFQYTAKQTPLVANQFWFQHSFTKDKIVLAESLTVDIPKDRKIKINFRPEYKPEASSSGNRSIFQWHASNSSVESSRVHELQKQVMTGTAPVPSIELSTFESWDQVGSWYYGLQRERSSPTPSIKTKALELTRGLTTDEEKIKTLYEFVALNFRYISIDFGIGRYQPHAADEVLGNKYGDCKDKHTLFAALLESVGIHSYPVLINTHRNVDPEVPSPGQFNHLMTAIPVGKSTLFLDTTPEIAPYGMLLSPLRHKKALVIMGPASAQFIETPAELPFKAQEVFDLKGKIDESGTLEAEVDNFFHGDVEVILKELFRQASPSKYKDLVQGMSYYAGFAGEVSQVKVEGLEALDKGLRIAYHYHRPEYLNLSDQPPKKSLPLSFSHFPKWTEDDKFIRLYPSKGELIFKCRIELPQGVTIQPPLDVKLERDYIRYQTTYSAQKNVVTAERKIEVLNPEVGSERRQDYEAFERSLSSDESQNMIVRLPQGFVAKSSSPSSESADELMRRAEIEYRERNYTDSYADYRKVSELDPKRKGIWTRMGLVEGQLRRYDDAIKDYQKALNADAFDAQAHAELGGLYLNSAVNKPELALEELNKATQIDPLSHRAHYLLGWYYTVKKNDYANAVPELEKALSTGNGFNDEVQIREMLTDGYFKLKQFDKGIEGIKAAVEAAPNPAVWNNSAYKLAENGQALELAKQYADSALKEIYDHLNQLDPSSIRLPDFVFMARLAMTWDTIGWIHFKAGHPELAEKYVRAAWGLAQHKIAAEHLGEIYEKLGKPTEAAEFYAMSATRIFMGQPPKPDPGRDHLIKMLGKQRAEQLIETKVNEPSQRRTIHLGNIAPAGSKGEFYFVFAPGPKLVSIQPSNGDSTLADQLRKQEDKIAASVSFPEDSPHQIIREGLVMCTAYSKSCDLVFVNSDMPNNQRIASSGNTQ